MIPAKALQRKWYNEDGFYADSMYVGMYVSLPYGPPVSGRLFGPSDASKSKSSKSNHLPGRGFHARNRSADPSNSVKEIPITRGDVTEWGKARAKNAQSRYNRTNSNGTGGNENDNIAGSRAENEIAEGSTEAQTKSTSNGGMYPGNPPPQMQASAPPQQYQYGGPPQQQMGGAYPHQGPPQQQMGGAYPPQGQPPQQMGGAYPPQGPPPQQMGGAYPPPQGPPQDGHAPWQPGQGEPHKWDDVPQQPVDDDPNAEPPPYVPPSNVQAVQGYEGCGGFGQPAFMPPPPPPPPPSESAPPMEFDSVAMLKEDECRQAMLEFVAQHCCYGKKPAENMKINKILPSTAMHYVLETFCERRSTGYALEPYRGGLVDGPHMGPAPTPWDILCQPDSQFQDHQKHLVVPHTASVQPCHLCGALGFVRCHRCRGMGRTRCISCHGSGHVSRTNAEGHRVSHSCHSCGGNGRKRCFTCHGHGRIICHQCQGYRQIRCFIRLTVEYKNNTSEYILEKTDMPDELVKNVQGTKIFEQVLPQVWPIVAYQVEEVNENSKRLVDEHYRSFMDSRKLLQRHHLRAVPVTEVHYHWGDVNTRFWVYGRERQVHAPDYPHQCCWGCNIL